MIGQQSRYPGFARSYLRGLIEQYGAKVKVIKVIEWESKGWHREPLY